MGGGGGVGRWGGGKIGQGRGCLNAPTCRSENSHYLFPSMTSTEMPLSNGSFNAHCFIVRSVVVNLTIHVTVCTDLFRCRSTFGYTQPTSYKTNITLKVFIQNRPITEAPGNSVNPDQTTRSVASDQGLQCFH